MFVIILIELIAMKLGDSSKSRSTHYIFFLYHNSHGTKLNPRLLLVKIIV